jgi:hypothetical protein
MRSLGVNRRTHTNNGVARTIHKYSVPPLPLPMSNFFYSVHFGISIYFRFITRMGRLVKNGR